MYIKTKRSLNKIENSRWTLGCTSIHFFVTFLFNFAVCVLLLAQFFVLSFNTLLSNHTFRWPENIFMPSSPSHSLTLQTIKNNNIIINQARCFFCLSAANLMNFTIIFFPLTFCLRVCRWFSAFLKQLSIESAKSTLGLCSSNRFFFSLWMHFEQLCNGMTSHKSSNRFFPLNNHNWF